MIAHRAGVSQLWAWLEQVPDPEIPAISIVDLGIVRDLAWASGDSDAVLKVTVTPTYSGCPATRVIQREIESALAQHGVTRVTIEVRLAPPWTTEWLSEAGRAKLRAYGIAPPERATSDPLDLTQFAAPDVACPRCAAQDVELTSQFGSTPCKALYRCNACREPFDYFKCH